MTRRVGQRTSAPMVAGPGGRNVLDTVYEGLANGDVPYFDSAAQVWRNLALGTNGQALMSDGSGLVYGNPTAGAHVHGASDITTETLVEVRGGTGMATYTQGDILAADGADSLAALAVGSAGDTLGTDGTDVAWRKNNFAASTDPDANEDSGDGYEIGSVWINTTEARVWVCEDATSTAAVWLMTSGRISCLVKRTVNFSVSHNTTTAVPYGTGVASKSWDTDSMHSLSTNPNRITFNEDGMYYIRAPTLWATNTSGRRQTGIRLDGSAFIDFQQVEPSDSSLTGTMAQCVYPISAGSYAEHTVYQNSGGNLNMLFSGSDDTSHFTATWVAPLAAA